MENQSLKVIIKPVPRASVQNRHNIPVVVWDPIKKQRVDLGQTSGKTKASKAVDIYSFDQDIQRGVYVTGLEELIINPFKEMDYLDVKMQYGLVDKWDNFLQSLVKQDKISKQVYFEIIDAVDPGYYTSKISQSILNLGSTFDAKLPKTFIEKFNITLYDGANVFSADTSRGRFAIQLVKNKRNIAKTKDGANPNYHTFYIAEENEEELDRVRNDRYENNAIAALASIQAKYPPFKLYQIAAILKNESGGALINTLGDVAPQIVEDQLNRYIKAKNSSKLARIENFLSVVKTFNDEPERFLVEYMCAQAYANRLINNREGYLYWNSKMDNPTQYKWKNENSFKNYILEQYKLYNPKQPDDTNGYAELKVELLQKGVKFE